jgi:DNA-binding NarL/FixJ family response regulator
VVGDAFNTDGAWTAIEQLSPDLILLDLELPGTGGLELARHVRDTHPAIKVVILSGHAESKYVTEALRIGVSGYILKSNASIQLIAALRAVLAGKVFLCPEISTLVVREYRRTVDSGQRGGSSLSSRELEVLKGIAAGQSTKELAFALGVSTKTIETHRTRLMEKLGVRTVAELVKYALREGLTTL